MGKDVETEYGEAKDVVVTMPVERGPGFRQILSGMLHPLLDARSITTGLDSCFGTVLRKSLFSWLQPTDGKPDLELCLTGEGDGRTQSKM